MSVLNIVELQNVVTSSSGLTPIGYLSNQITNIQQIVDYDKKQINVNAISNFNTSPIQVYAGLNLCNTAISYNGTIFAGSNAPSTTGNLGSVSTGLLTIGFSTGSGLAFIQGGTSSFVIASDGKATFSDTVTATGFLTASDYRLKDDVRPITDYQTILSSVDGVRFHWKKTGEADVGVIAQSLLSVLPEAVTESGGIYKVDYSKLIPVLIQSVKALQERVAVLERGFNVIQQAI